MRKIELKTVEVITAAIRAARADGAEIPGQQIRYADVIFGILEYKSDDQGRPMPIPTSEQRRCAKIQERLDATKDDVLLLEDEDYGYLAGRVERHAWPSYNQAFLDFADAIKNAEKVTPAE